MFDLTARQQEYLLQLLETARKELLHELHHTSTRRFGETIREHIAVNEEVAAAIRSVERRPAA